MLTRAENAASKRLRGEIAAALKAREHGYRAVSISAATRLVARGASLRKEYRPKVRTIARRRPRARHSRVDARRARAPAEDPRGARLPPGRQRRGRAELR